MIGIRNKALNGTGSEMPGPMLRFLSLSIYICIIFLCLTRSSTVSRFLQNADNDPPLYTASYKSEDSNF
jgi:hypothetical protein